MSNLEKLYYNMDKLNDNWVDTSEVKAASDRLEKALGEELYGEYEDDTGIGSAGTWNDTYFCIFLYIILFMQIDTRETGCGS